VEALIVLDVLEGFEPLLVEALIVLDVLEGFEVIVQRA
jgi:hypothetical protein